MSTAKSKMDNDCVAAAPWCLAALQHTSDAILAIDHDWNVVYANPSAEHLLRATQSELLGSPLKHCVPFVDTGASIPISLDQLLIQSANHDTKKHWTITDRLGQQHDVECRVVPLDNTNGDKHSAIVFLRIPELTESVRPDRFRTNHRDALTGTTDRYVFSNELQRVIERTRPSSQPSCLCYLDIHQLRVVNEVCGLAAGDELLKQVSRLIQRHLEKADSLCRFSGDEFLLLLSGCNRSLAQERLDALIEGLAAYRFVWEKHNYAVGINVGVVEIESDAHAAEQLIVQAIGACAAARQSGSNGIHLFDADSPYLAQRRNDMLWVNRINDALDSDRFYLCAQPIERTINQAAVDARYRHFEILIRMYDDNNDSVAPGAFLPAAERYGLISQIDRWVLRQTLKWLANHAAVLDSLDCCSINLSGKSLADKHFLDYCLENLKRYAMPASKLCFEITETAVVNNVSTALKLINTLREYGCRFALDDFGSGLSSFAYLQRFPVDFLKIDGMFIRDICDDSMHRTLVSSINTIGQELGITTIAEFVESDATRDCLAEIGVDLVQGFGVGRPDPIGQLS